MSHGDIYIGMKVLYVPSHAKGDLTHKDVEKGVVTSKNEQYIFVRFGGDTHGKACSANNLQ